MTPLKWDGERLSVLDQALLPHRESWRRCRTSEDAARAITEMAVRGAPAIGITAAYGMVLAARAGEDLDSAAKRLAAARPTAVNLAMAVDRLLAAGPAADDMEAEARAMWQEDHDSCETIGRAGLELVPSGARILTHCNTGALATAGDGTALAVIRAAHRAGRLEQAYCTETRPWLQGARLTAWELGQEGIPRTLLVDSAAASLMRHGGIDLVILGADRVASNGDVANKVGTLSLALAAHGCGVPFYVALPLTTLDRELASGDGIRIEERPGDEVRRLGETQIAQPDTPVYNPVFDVTGGELVTAFVTDAGVVRPPYGSWPVG